MRFFTSHIILFLLLYHSSFVTAQTENSKIKTDSLNVSFLEALIKTRIDSVRKVNKVQPLVSNDTLDKAANDQATYMMKKKNLTHLQDNANKKDVDDRIKYYGMENSAVGENIAFTYIYTPIAKNKKSTYINTTYKETANDIVNLWVNSEGHFENMTDSNYYYTAVAVSYDKKLKRIYAVQVFSSE